MACTTSVNLALAGLFKVSVLPPGGWGPGGLGRLDPGCPSAGREFGDSIERKIGQAREDRAEVVADR